MTCRTCQSEVARVRIANGIDQCPNCSPFSEAGGIRLDGILSRQRVAHEAVKYEGDTLNPWQYDKSGHKFEPNPEFLKRHGNNAQNFFTPDDLGAYPKLAEEIKRGFQDDVQTEQVGDTDKAITKAVKEAS